MLLPLCCGESVIRPFSSDSVACNAKGSPRSYFLRRDMIIPTILSTFLQDMNRNLGLLPYIHDLVLRLSYPRPFVVLAFVRPILKRALADLVAERHL